MFQEKKIKRTSIFFRVISALFFGFISLCVMPFGVHAEMVQASLEDRAPVEVTINELRYEQDSQQIVLDLTIGNNTRDFIDGISSTLVMYKGEELQEEGYLFEGMEQMYTTGEELAGLSPQEVRKETLSYDIPGTIESGKYFVQYSITDNEIKYYGVDYFGNSIEVSGSGSFIGDIAAFVTNEEGNIDLDGGQLLDSDQSISVVIRLDENEKLAQKLNEEKIFIKARVISVAEEGQILREFPVEEMQVDEEGKVVYTIVPWKEMPTGTMTIELLIFDANNNEIANSIMARWFRAQRVSRVAKVETQTNFYEKGDDLDLNVVGSFFQFDEGDTFLITAEVLSDGAKYEFTKKYVFEKENPEEMRFDFSDEKMSKKGKVQSIMVSIKDEARGEIKDEYVHELNQDGNYVKGEEKQETPMDILSFLKKTLIAFAIIVPIGLVIFLLTRKKVSAKTYVFFCGLIAGSFLLYDPAQAVICPAPSAICYPGKTPGTISLTHKSHSSGSIGIAPNCTISVEKVYAYMTCSTCLNGVRGGFGLEIQKANGTALGSTCRTFGDQGHKYHWKTDSKRWIPPGAYNFSYNIQNAGSYRYRLVANSSEGCKCYADSWKSSWYYVTCDAPAPYCGDGKVTSPEQCDTTWSGNTYSVDDCTAGYGETCEYCVSPSGGNEKCTIKEKSGPFCGDGTVQASQGEQCDAGGQNGVVCNAAYDSTCNYCDNSCRTQVAIGPYCGDGNRNGSEQCDGEPDCTATCTRPCLCDVDDGTFQIDQPANTCTFGGTNWITNTSTQWRWTCDPNNDCNTTAGPCSAECVQIDIDAPSNIYLSKDGNELDVEVRIEGKDKVDLTSGTCDIKMGSQTKQGVGIDSDGIAEVTFDYQGAGATINAECTLRVDCGGGSSYATKTYTAEPHGVTSLCAERSCNAQGTCQATPRLGVTSVNDCTSTCTSDADCSSGRMIETRP